LDKCLGIPRWSGDDDRTIKLWSLPEGQLLATLGRQKYTVDALAITPDGTMLISGNSGGAIIIWDLELKNFRTFLFDPKVNVYDAIAFNVYDKVTGQTITYTLPCGSPIPPGAASSWAIPLSETKGSPNQRLAGAATSPEEENKVLGARIEALERLAKHALGKQSVKTSLVDA
jgi:WD40 repeat protein